MIAPPDGFPARLRSLRESRHLSQREVAERCQRVSYAYISRLEHGARTPTVRAIRELAAALGVTPDELEFGEQGIKMNPTFRAMQRRLLMTEAEMRSIRATIKHLHDTIPDEEFIDSRPVKRILASMLPPGAE